MMAAARTIRSGWVAQGPQVEAFEAEMCARLGLPAGHAVSFSSGTAALFVALWTHGVSGRGVAIPVYVCSAVRDAVLMAGGEVVLIDIAPDSPNIDLSALAASGADIAVVPHMFGIPVNMAAIPSGMTVVEDCAQSLGALVCGRPSGVNGDTGVFSFYVSKLITSGGQGGMVVSRNRDLIDAIRDYRQFDCRDDRKARFNLQMTDLQAAIGRVQLRRLDEFLARRDVSFGRYLSYGMDLVGRGAASAVRYRAVLRTDAPDAVIRALSSSGVRAIVPVEAWELLGDASDFPNANRFCSTTVSLPLYPTLSDSDVDCIARICKSV